MSLELSIVPADTSLPVLETTVGSLLRECAADSPDAVALVDGSRTGERRRWSYDELLARAEDAAHALLGRLEPGSRVAIWAPTSPEWLIFWYGAALAGMPLVTINPAYRARELHYVLEQSAVQGVALVSQVRGNPMRAWLDEVLPDLPLVKVVMDLDEIISTDCDAVGLGRPPLPTVRPDDVAQIQYTSGTTGFPKGAMLHHRGITNNARFYAHRLAMQRSEVYLSPLPMFHVGGSVLSPLAVMWTRSVLVPMTRFDAGHALELIESEHVTTLIGVPTMFLDMLDRPDFSPERVSSVRHIMCGGAYTPSELVKRLADTYGANVHNSFGQTECGPVMTMTGVEDTPEDVAETVGRPFPQIELKIVDVDSGDVVPRGEPGELCARGYQVMRGYYRMHDFTASTIDGDGWLHTGDICSVDDRGYFTVEGRIKEMIIRGGENIFPQEIEEVLFQHPGVVDVAVVGLPDQRLGEVVGAFVRRDLSVELDAAALSTFASAQLAREKVPAHWIFVDSFPLTANGKIRKHELREQFAQGSS